jgi:CDP-glucose 4,6-dehydratase
MESMVNQGFWKKKRVFITGHTGFKGAWLTLWLKRLDAEVTGYSLEPPTTPNLYDLARIEELINGIEADIRDFDRLKKAIEAHQPEIVFHLAAQALVRRSYQAPVETYATNVMGTVNVLEAVRQVGGVRVFVNVTSDKCYENREWGRGYRETEPMGGYDPYSSSKGCAELITAAYRNSYFNPANYSMHGMALASARAGNVVGGGDWGEDRLVPDCVRAFLKGEKIVIRSPEASRPWQHVLEPLNGYLMLAERLYNDGIEFAQPWNFGPNDHDAKTVEWVVSKFCEEWDNAPGYVIEKGPHLHEANYLKLDCSKAMTELGWLPKWDVETAIYKVIHWTKQYQAGSDMRDICYEQVEEYKTFTNYVGLNIPKFEIIQESLEPVS